MTLTKVKVKRVKVKLEENAQNFNMTYLQIPMYIGILPLHMQLVTKRCLVYVCSYVTMDKGQNLYCCMVTKQILKDIHIW